MIPAVLVLLAGVPLVVLPILTLPATPLFWLSGLAGVLCVVGAVLRSIPIAAAATMVAVLAYTLALWLAEAPHDLAGAIVFGIALVIVLEGTATARRFRGAAVLPSALRGQARHWLGLAAAAVMLVGGIAALAELAVFRGPSVLHAAVAALGAVAVVVGLVGMLRQGAGTTRDASRAPAARTESEPPP